MTDEAQNLPQSANVAGRRRNTRQISSTQVMFAVILAIGLMLAIQFSSRIEQDQDLSNIKNTILEEIDLLQRERAELERELAFVESDAYVENWAHSEGRMIREGEVLVIPIPAAASLAQSIQEIEPEIAAPIDTTLPDPVMWHLWWALFFDRPPPEFS